MNQDILVLTATLGERDSLSRTIESVRSIAGNRVRHIVVCPDSKIDLIKTKYGKIECLAEPKGKKGIYAALNHGFNTYGKEYKYLTFINDDDYWLPDFAKIIEAITRDESLDLVYGYTRYVNENNIMIGRQSCYPKFEAFSTLLSHNIIMLTQQATLMKSSLFFCVGGFDESYKLVADTKFWAMASLKRAKYRYINKECAAYMIQQGQLSSDHHTQSREHARIFEELDIRKNSYYFTYLLFRLYNLPLYIKRLFRINGFIPKPYIVGSR